MPTTDLDIPILQYFFCSVEGATGMPPQPLDATPQQFAEAQRKEQQQDGDTKSTPLPKGVVLGPDGKPYVTNVTTQTGYHILSVATDAARVHRPPHGER